MVEAEVLVGVEVRVGELRIGCERPGFVALALEGHAHTLLGGHSDGFVGLRQVCRQHDVESLQSAIEVAPIQQDTSLAEACEDPRTRSAVVVRRHTVRAQSFVLERLVGLEARTRVGILVLFLVRRCRLGLVVLLLLDDARGIDGGEHERGGCFLTRLVRVPVPGSVAAACDDQPNDTELNGATIGLDPLGEGSEAAGHRVVDHFAGIEAGGADAVGATLGALFGLLHFASGLLADALVAVLGRSGPLPLGALLLLLRDDSFLGLAAVFALRILVFFVPAHGARL